MGNTQIQIWIKMSLKNFGRYKQSYGNSKILDGIYTSILKLLTTFEKLGAYEIGLIDKDGVVDKKRKAELKLTMDGKNGFVYSLHYILRLVIRLKSLLAKVPVNHLSQDMCDISTY